MDKTLNVKMDPGYKSLRYETLQFCCLTGVLSYLSYDCDRRCILKNVWHFRVRVSCFAKMSLIMLGHC